MIKYDDWFEPIQVALSTHVDGTVIQAETTGEQPPYPFIAIKQTTVASPVGEASFKTGVNSQEQRQNVEFVLSFTAHGSTIEQATDLASNAYAYFTGKAFYDLSDHNIAIVQVFDATNRDVFLNIEYERRVGFDVRVRMLDVNVYTIQTINEIIIE